MTLIPRPPQELTEAAVWQDVEYGAYAADLPVWSELAAAAGGPVLEVGAGSGRVSLHLARQGITVVAVDADPELAGELELRARAHELPLTALAADVTGPRVGDAVPGGPFPLAIAPLQVFQLFDTDGRRRALSALAGLLTAGGALAVALVDESTIGRSEAALPPPTPPDMREVDGWVFSSEPLWVQASDEMLRMRRLRQRVSPSGDLVRNVHDDLLHRVPPEVLEAEASEAGLEPAGRSHVAAGENEAGSVVVILGRAMESDAR